VEHTPSGLSQPIRLPGQHADGDTGLYYNRYRYYDSWLGVYINKDPIGLSSGPNTYNYSLNNPIEVYDPTGLIPPLIVIAYLTAIGAGTGGAASYIKQKFIDKKCNVNQKDIINGILWGAAGGAAMPFVGASVIGAMGVGGVAGVGQYVSGGIINNESINMQSAIINGAMGAAGGSVGGTFINKMPWNPPKGWMGVRPYDDQPMPQLVFDAALKDTLRSNLSAKSIGQGAAGAQLGNQTELPCLTCESKCE
ncbi:RHS repeat-associated core domain-containing protein, partial [Comamonas sp. B-9]|uniref:RHS repeat-associated core domain-containing protein n=1 Tax=Comamonas sp. B-9 TaxID=1055192 RepID=UPI0011DCD465